MDAIRIGQRMRRVRTKCRDISDAARLTTPLLDSIHQKRQIFSSRIHFDLRFDSHPHSASVSKSPTEISFTIKRWTPASLSSSRTPVPPPTSPQRR
ncbi:hypothetical protein BV898_07009 [Hypsibius exemplaris]|uniref:Uncharacterized protein n=1 Tax=Hypsibius exemplaris TaxID=2072580 RepID=A0A1W0WUU6_HYPEX|nr:hypothetical protein BV898_07009 [Hypsibius exemplaris]